MLLGFKAVVASGLLTEVEELTNGVAEFGELAISGEGEIGRGGRMSAAAQYKYRITI